ncbi:DEAD/DEAH box helicase [Corynebacterium sphenisci]|uniref:DEAD/DEAH box helicase n=1 Tax=Corynebacterium sphenisci TaxID=191493 RepID=UPI0026DF4738|nr:DEAD/DEAH box helicase [Corynebacterium sphenisci]MDO5730071.1 DEAD/DEAH box helicase [Corynebacterium sphenisci]
MPEPVTGVLRRLGLTRPTPVQAAVLPDALAGRDILGRAPTGTGKTLAFAIPMVARLATGHALAGRPRGLVITPTRELADQVGDVLADLGAARGLRTVVLVGGERPARQRRLLAAPADIVVATPGRALQHLREGRLHLADVVVAVVDEADELADRGFLPELDRILDRLPRGTQLMAFSATLGDRVAPLLARLREPARHEVGGAGAGGADRAGAVTRMRHLLLPVADDAAADRLLPWIAARAGRTVLFVSGRHRVGEVAATLAAAGVACRTIHGERGQTARRAALADFAGGACPVLVATDVAARGLDIGGLDLVVHVDPAADPATYVHRSGRTARSGDAGTVATVARARQLDAARRVLDAAGVTPETLAAAPGSPALAEALGARRPPGPRRRPGAVPRGNPRGGRRRGGRRG